jgi:hypothetical protein
VPLGDATDAWLPAWIPGPAGCWGGPLCQRTADKTSPPPDHIMGSRGAGGEDTTLLGPDLEAVARRVFALYCDVGDTRGRGGGGGGNSSQQTAATSFGLPEYLRAERLIHTAVHLPFEEQVVAEEFRRELTWPETYGSLSGGGGEEVGRAAWPQYERWLAWQLRRHSCAEPVMATYLAKVAAILGQDSTTLPVSTVPMLPEGTPPQQQEPAPEPAPAANPLAPPAATTAVAVTAPLQIEKGQDGEGEEMAPRTGAVQQGHTSAASKITPAVRTTVAFTFTEAG